MIAQAYAFGAANLDSTGKPLTFARAVTGPDAAQWQQAWQEEWERLGPEGTQTVHYAKTSTLPTDRQSSYLMPVVKEKTKEFVRTFRVRNTFGGDRSDYVGETKADTGDIESFKILLNATISDPESRMVCVDISDFYLHEDLEVWEYMKVHLKDIPVAIVTKHGLADLADDRGYVLLVVTKTMYGLKQSGRICRMGLVKQLAKHGYHADATTPTIFSHDTRPTSFELVVDDFAVKYKPLNEGDLDHFLAALKEKYRIKVDMAASKFIGITLAWQYEQGARSVTLSMPGYVEKALERFGVVRGPKVNSPMRFTPPRYGTGTQQEPEEHPDSAVPGTAADTLRLQQIVGTFLYLARCVDGITTIAVNSLSSGQSNPTALVMSDSELLLQYFAWHPNPTVTFTPSDMHLFLHSDASFAGESGARSRVGAVYMLGDTPSSLVPLPALRQPFLVASVVLKTTAQNISEAEYGGLFTATQRSVPLRNTLAALGYPQPATTAVTDNSVAKGIATGTIKQKRSRSINIAYHWIRDQVTQGYFNVLWDKGNRNLADYQTKAVPAKDFQAIKPTYQNI
jgi:hypothetical protein